jgi:hypothetical protein
MCLLIYNVSRVSSVLFPLFYVLCPYVSDVLFLSWKDCTARQTVDWTLSLCLTAVSWLARVGSCITMTIVCVCVCGGGGVMHDGYIVQ